MAGRNPVLERLKQKIKVLEHQELPFNQVAFDILQAYLKEDIVVNNTTFDRVMYELKLKYQSQVKQILEEEESKQKFIQKKLF